MRVDRNYRDRNTGRRIYTRWGVFTNLLDTGDRQMVGAILDLHTPWLVFRVFS